MSNLQTNASVHKYGKAYVVRIGLFNKPNSTIVGKGVPKFVVNGCDKLKIFFSGSLLIVKFVYYANKCYNDSLTFVNYVFLNSFVMFEGKVDLFIFRKIEINNIRFKH